MNAIQEYIDVPSHIFAIADACLRDLYNGPGWIRLPGGDITHIDADCDGPDRESMVEDSEPGDVIESRYTGTASDALRAFIDDLPCDLWVEGDSVSDCEPQDSWEEEDTGEVDEEGEPIFKDVCFSPSGEDIAHFDRRGSIRQDVCTGV